MKVTTGSTSIRIEIFDNQKDVDSLQTWLFENCPCLKPGKTITKILSFFEGESIFSIGSCLNNYFKPVFIVDCRDGKDGSFNA